MQHIFAVNQGEISKTSLQVSYNHPTVSLSDKANELDKKLTKKSAANSLKVSLERF